jgi:hypothetical protein
MPRTRGGANGSFRLLWIRAAPPIMIARQPAAAGVRIGAILKAHGKVRPSAPKISAQPISLICIAEKSFTQPMCSLARSCAFERRAFMPPANRRIAAKRPCTTQSAMFMISPTFDAGVVAPERRNRVEVELVALMQPRDEGLFAVRRRGAPPPRPTSGLAQADRRFSSRARSQALRARLQSCTGFLSHAIRRPLHLRTRSPRT